MLNQPKLAIKRIKKLIAMKIKLKHYVQFRVSFIYCRISFLGFVKRVVIQRVTRDGLGIGKKKKKKERRRRIRGRRAVECPGAVSKPRNRDERNRAITSEPFRRFKF